MVPSRRPRPGSTATLAVVLALGGAGAAGCGGEDPFAIRRGAPDAGFPLRGDLRDDAGALRDAGAAWFADDRDRNRGDVFRGDRDATALWAGRVGGRDTVILAHRGAAALVHRTDDGWDVSASTACGTELRPRLAAFPEAVLTADRAPSAYRAAAPDARPVGVRDGLWASSGPDGPAQLPEGVLVLGDGLVGPDSPTGTELLVTGFALTGNRSPQGTATPELRRRILAADRKAGLPFLQRFVAASVVAADRSPAVSGPPAIDLASDGRVDGVGRLTVITTAYAGVRSVASAGLGGSASRSGARALTVRLEDQHAGAVALRGRDGPALGSTTLYAGDGTSAPPRLLVAGDRRIRRIEVTAGRRRTVRPGPVATIPAPAPGDRARTDTVIVGRTADGSAVLPGPQGAATTLPPP